MNGPRLLKVAAIQAAAVHLDLPASLERALTLVASAASRGARLVAFPETWLPGYPAWLDCCKDVALWDHEPMKRVFGRLRANSVVVPGPVTGTLGEAARAHDVVLNIGVHERVDEGPGRGTLFNTMLTFGADGSLIHAHRKIMPTFSEKLIWGAGDGSSPGEDVHVAAWPQVKEMNLVASRSYAFEGRCFVIATGGIMRARDLPPELEPMAALHDKPETLVLNGGSSIIGPDGALLAGPVYDTETILTADVDLDRVGQESLTLDVAGHYHRPDIFDVRVRAKS
jgi:predicted amidohydrolase